MKNPPEIPITERVIKLKTLLYLINLYLFEVVPQLIYSKLIRNKLI